MVFLRFSYGFPPLNHDKTGRSPKKAMGEFDGRLQDFGTDV
jgi:hypothetical protein